MNMLASAQAIGDEIVRLRRDIHAHPELGFQEVRTAALVADTLAELGIQHQTAVGRTGVVAEIGNGNGPVIGIRADMDALPIVEHTGVEYASRNHGVMHACGHDAHTAILLGVAHLLKQSYIDVPWQGKVRLLFQPSEETGDADGISGAMAMIADGALEGVDRVLALHVDSTKPAGQVIFADGPAMASVDTFEGWIHGTGGHGAYPHAGTDPIFMLSQVLNYLYAIPSRRIDPLQSCVVSVGQVQGGATSNVIPNEVYLYGTIRAFTPEVRERLWAEVENGFRLAEQFGGSYRFKLQKGYPPAVFDPIVNNMFQQTVGDLVGNGAIKVAHPAFGMGAEDFAYMTQKAPGAMFLLGAALDDSRLRLHHTDIFDIDERVLPLGAAILAETAQRYLRGDYALD